MGWWPWCSKIRIIPAYRLYRWQSLPSIDYDHGESRRYNGFFFEQGTIENGHFSVRGEFDELQMVVFRGVNVSNSGSAWANGEESCDTSCVPITCSRKSLFPCRLTAFPKIRTSRFQFRLTLVRKNKSYPGGVHHTGHLHWYTKDWFIRFLENIMVFPERNRCISECFEKSSWLFVCMFEDGF